jgi:Ca2+-binding EF-hand superfamily protein
LTQKEVEQLLRVIDDNKNRTVDKEELLKLYRRLMRSWSW